MRRVLLLAVLLALAACSKGPAASNAANLAANAASATPAVDTSPATTLPKIFTQDMLGANLKYLETITGPAFKTEGAVNVYKVDGCTVIVGAEKGVIENLGIEGYSDRCSFNIAQYFAGGYVRRSPASPASAGSRPASAAPSPPIAWKAAATPPTRWSRWSTKAATRTTSMT
ncbi:MAG: hypothetical protein ACHP7N_04075 [Caulobacterales bacterium]